MESVLLKPEILGCGLVALEKKRQFCKGSLEFGISMKCSYNAVCSTATENLKTLNICSMNLRRKITNITMLENKIERVGKQERKNLLKAPKGKSK